nr:Exodeoxyribonuclease V gamma chain [Klebsiella pneumoniae]
MLRVYHSNRLDVLEALMEFIVERQRLDDPFRPKWCWCRVPAWRSGCR